MDNERSHLLRAKKKEEAEREKRQEKKTKRGADEGR